MVQVKMNINNQCFPLVELSGIEPPALFLAPYQITQVIPSGAVLTNFSLFLQLKCLVFGYQSLAAI